MPNTTPTHIPMIVYVEDNAGDALILGETLRECGHAVELKVIDHGEKALRYFQLKAKVKDVPPPHCILLDAYLPIITGVQLLQFIRGTEAYRDAPVYIFAPEASYKGIIQTQLVSKETFLTKPNSWKGFLELSDLLMASAKAKRDNVRATPADSKPEVHAEGALRRQDTKLRRQDTKQQRDQANQISGGAQR